VFTVAIPVPFCSLAIQLFFISSQPPSPNIASMQSGNEVERWGTAMDLVLEVRTGRDRVMMACRGQLIEGKEIEAFRRSALLLLGGFERVTINLGGVRRADREGWNCLAALLAAADERGRKLRIIHAGHLHMLETAGVADMVPQPQAPPDHAGAAA
jgi:hypothetical protein